MITTLLGSQFWGCHQIMTTVLVHSATLISNLLQRTEGAGLADAKKMHSLSLEFRSSFRVILNPRDRMEPIMIHNT